MKRFILFLCKTFNVQLVEPNQQILHTNYVHEKVPYTLVQKTTQVSKYDIPREQLEDAIYRIKRDMVHNCMAELETSNILTFTQFEDYMGTITVRCSFFAAPIKQQQ
jgi:hypothetical protein